MLRVKNWNGIKDGIKISCFKDAPMNFTVKKIKIPRDILSSAIKFARKNFILSGQQISNECASHLFVI